MLFNLEERKTQLQELVTRKEFFSSAEIMIQVIGTAGELLALSGKRNPYGKLGVVEANAMADLLIYSENPLEDVSIDADSGKKASIHHERRPRVEEHPGSA